MAEAPWYERRERGSTLGMRVTVACYRAFGRWLALALLPGIVAYFFASDAAARRASRAYLERARGRVLIMDRYFYDTLVDLTNGRPGPWTRLLERLTPRPTVPVFLDITPEESFRRKREFTIDYLRRRADAYRRVFDRVPNAVRLPNDDLERTKAALLRAIP